MKYWFILASYACFLIVSIYFKGDGYTSWISLATTFVVFIFAIFLAFSISNRRDRIINLRGALRELDGVTISLYNYSKVFGKDYSAKLLQLIDDYFIQQIDYALVDFRKTQGMFMEIYDYVSKTKVVNDEQQDAKMAMMADLENTMKLREKVEFSLSDRMQPYEWVTIIALAILTVGSMIYINDGSWVALAILPILETVVLVIFVTIYDLDSLRWQEQNWIWEPLSAMFIALGLLPYFPDDLIFLKRVPKSFLSQFKSYRVGKYKHPYPNFDDKVVQVVDNNDKRS
ncbi:hypothetical protein HGB25_02295 [Candidatus Saccharibacteria bacterium]|nr:hypothetical protein [Candidatus Saccharibacteria bacterium]